MKFFVCIAMSLVAMAACVPFNGPFGIYDHRQRLDGLAWSDDGRTLYFVYENGDGAYVYKWDPTGGIELVVDTKQELAPVCHASPRISLDAVHDTLFLSGHQTFSYSLSRRQESHVVFTTIGADFPRLIPDERVSFLVRTNDSDDLYVSGLNSSAAKKVLSLGNLSAFYEWSPDHSKVAAFATQPETGKVALAVLQPATSRRSIFLPGYHFISWAGSETLLVKKYDQLPNEDPIYAYSLETGKTRVFLDFDAIYGRSNRDGSSIAFLGFEEAPFAKYGRTGIIGISGLQKTYYDKIVSIDWLPKGAPRSCTP